MMEQQQLSWRQFMETGQVSDYLNYRGVAQPGQKAPSARAAMVSVEVEQLAVDGGRPGDPGAQHG